MDLVRSLCTVTPMKDIWSINTPWQSLLVCSVTYPNVDHVSNVSAVRRPTGSPVLPVGHADVFRRVRKLRKATVSLVVSVRLSAWNNTGSHWTDFREI